MTEPTPLAEFSTLTMPVLYMLGDDSPESAKAVARLLLPVLPRATVKTFDGLGHMAPITHAEIINAVIAEYLRGV